jgi:dTDP-4-amino-4,6-dideoxygalactose transaminase
MKPIARESSILALHGGDPVRTKRYPPHITTGQQEMDAVTRVMASGILSDFEGSNNQWFLGGVEVKSLEEEWASYFGVKFAVCMNSATSGLIAAVGAAGVGPGDEIITTPWTMAATATAIIANNAVPVFCDIDPNTFCMCPSSVRKRITSRTKAIMPVHIYGHPAPMREIMALAQDHGLVVIEDAAQSPGALYHSRFTGTIGHMGVFSLNCHKIIQTGEGGVVVTNDETFAQRLRLIRNHAEAVVATGMPVRSMVNMVGWNFRMGELEAAIGKVQLTKLTSLLNERLDLVLDLNRRLERFDGLLLPTVPDECTHSFYRYALRLDPTRVPVTAPQLVEALNAEGMDFYAGYLPLHHYPLYQAEIAFGAKGCPFRCPLYEGQTDYSIHTRPGVAYAQQWSFSTEVVRPPLTSQDMAEIERAFGKIWPRLSDLCRDGNEGKQE